LPSVAVAGIVPQRVERAIVKVDAIMTVITGVTPQLAVRYVVQVDSCVTSSCCVYQSAVHDDKMAGRVCNPDTICSSISIDEIVGNEIGICFSSISTNNSILSYNKISISTD
jgi:hypothetical protein